MEGSNKKGKNACFNGESNEKKCGVFESVILENVFLTIHNQYSAMHFSNCVFLWNKQRKKCKIHNVC